VPSGEDELASWLNEWWSRIDDWIDACGESVNL
jgi:hypothetical protein